ncbi:site-specific integrase [Spongiactinospora sp. TRM90649]|uniref:tyrosine-type recombinase/integrase n=1 Tax=Spongiactinospora sp. TRM90649 TaxID=3031114 RepID=UPI0023F70CD8|nr:site-specific integrase [Spongiactinospora sp. TRM90649]MDF5756178.1 site-specific integrase [Spongiactinospora sp. TRM90649]
MTTIPDERKKRSRRRRANNEGTVYQRADGKWCGQVYVLITDGTEKRKTVYGKTSDEVRAKIDDLKIKSRRGVPAADRPWKVGEYLDYWLNEVARHSVRRTTFAKYETMVRLYLKPGLGRKKLDRLTVADVQGFLNGRLNGDHAIGTIHAMRNVLSTALTRAMREEILSRNVARLATLPPIEAKRDQPWTAAEARAFLQVARFDPLYPAFVLLLVYGLRRGEALGLRWADVDFDEDQVHIRQQLIRVGTDLHEAPVKTRARKRSLPMVGIVREALEIQRGGQKIRRERAGESWVETGLVFTTKSGRPIEPRNLARSFARIIAAEGLRPIRVHDLRHTAASLLKKLGVAPRDAMEILGHSRIAVTMEIYTHGDEESRQSAIGKVNDLFT